MLFLPGSADVPACNAPCKRGVELILFFAVERLYPMFASLLFAHDFGLWKWMLGRTTESVLSTMRINHPLFCAHEDDLCRSLTVSRRGASLSSDAGPEREDGGEGREGKE